MVGGEGEDAGGSLDEEGLGHVNYCGTEEFEDWQWWNEEALYPAELRVQPNPRTLS